MSVSNALIVIETIPGQRLRPNRASRTAISKALARFVQIGHVIRFFGGPASIHEVVSLRIASAQLSPTAAVLVQTLPFAAIE